MATPRKSAQQLAAREKAMAKAREMTERHEKLIELAAEFFQQQEQADIVRAEAKKKADALLAKAEADARSAVRGAATTVRAMLDSGEPKSSVAARLGLSGAELKRMLDLITDDPSSPASDQSEERDSSHADDQDVAA
ncbi:hypothetical protein V3C41_00155 [Paenarthrobacter nicotinovorans]|uniref:Uncharacterized protein n=1 Tax=Paenarthrobacter nicotinovorans TaxID=29320 RepID=A0ABV0GM04_PAENI